MKTLLALFLTGMVALEAGTAMTIEEYVAKSPEQKLSVLRGRPDRVLADTSQLLRLYSVSLKDRSTDVRRAAAQASVFLVMGLQEAKPAGKSPTFPEQDSADLQRALIELLKDEDKETRTASVMALAYSAPPVPEIENLLLSTIRAEKDDEIAGGMIEAMAQAGYGTEQFTSEVSKLFQRTADSRAAYTAGKVLGHLKSESALDMIISLASTPTPTQRHAIQALGAYGAKASKAKAALSALIQDQATQEDIRNLARISLEAINTDNHQASSLQPMKLTSLWPLAVVAASSDAPKQDAASTNTPSSVQQSAPEKATEQKPVPSTPVQESPASPRWPLVAAVIAATLGLLWLLLKKRK